MAAMAELIANHEPDFWWMKSNYRNLALYSYRIADAMIARRKVTPNVQIEGRAAFGASRSNAMLGVGCCSSDGMFWLQFLGYFFSSLLKAAPAAYAPPLGNAASPPRCS
jgi:hypothetical protein